MPPYCDKIKDPAKRKACNKAGYATKAKPKPKPKPRRKAKPINEMDRVRSTKRKGYK